LLDVSRTFPSPTSSHGHSPSNMEVLDKHRGKGQQTVRVEHVTVSAGGQAIVGNVQGGGGLSQKAEVEAHAESITHAPEQEVRSPFQEDREAMPQRSDEKRQVSNAWRAVAGRAERQSECAEARKPFIGAMNRSERGRKSAIPPLRQLYIHLLPARKGKCG
jgi:hypothetical protein